MKVNIVGEIGVNHNGSMATAKRMIDEVKKAGGDYAKFQFYHTAELNTLDEKTKQKVADYALTLNQLVELKQHSEEVGVKFLCTAMASPDTLQEYVLAVKPKLLKVREADSRKPEYMYAVLATGLPALVSVDPMKGPYQYLSPRMYDWYCLPQYPPNPADFVADYAYLFDGFSSHYPSIDIPLKALQAAKMASKELYWLECHVKLDDNCIDAPVSLTFNDFKKICDYAHSL